MSEVVTDGKTSMEDSLPARGTELPHSGAGVARKVAHLTPEECVARGKAARNEVPRSSHGRWEPAVNRPDPVGLLEQQGVSRVPSWFPSVTAGCWCRRSRSTGAPR